MGQGALIALVGLAVGGLKAFVHSLRYPTPIPSPWSTVRLMVCMVAAFALGGGILGLIRETRQK